MSGTASTLQGSITRNLAPFFEERKGARTQKNWLAFVGRGGGVQTIQNEVNEVVYEIMRGNRRTAKLVKRSNVVSRVLGSDQKNLELGSYTRVARAFPLSVEEYDIQASRLTEKVPGEPTENSGFTRQDRMVWWAARGQTELMTRQTRMMNYLCGQGILEGTQDAIIGTSDPDEQYDFYRNPLHSKTLGTTWNDATNATPLDDLDDGCDQVIDSTGNLPQFALMGDTAISAMLQTDQIQNQADNRGFTGFIRIGEAGVPCPPAFNYLTENGWECRGIVTTWKGRQLWVFGSEELLELTAGVSQRSMPSEKVVLGNNDSRLDAQFGPPETFPEDDMILQKYQSWFGFAPGVAPSGEPQLTNGIVRPEMFVLDAYGNQYNTLRTIRSQTAPLYVPVATDDWYVIENAGS
jgi:hypothetical protein